MKKELVEAVFLLIAVPVRNIWKLPNGYWPDTRAYDDVRSPWWLVKTDRGCIRIGCRKRVIEVDWSDTDVRAIVTEDDVTKDDEIVHAWSTKKLMEYMFTWAEEYRK